LRCLIRIHNSNFADSIFQAGGKGRDMVACLDLAIEYTNKKDHTFVVVIPRIN